MKPRARPRLRGTSEGSTFPFPPKDGQGKVKEAGYGRRGEEAVKESRKGGTDARRVTEERHNAGGKGDGQDRWDGEPILDLLTLD